jgi:hypothetical protein
MFTVVMLPVFLGLLALSVDLARQEVARSQLRSAGNAAAHGAMVAWRNSRSSSLGDVDSMARTLVDANLVDNTTATFDGLTLGNWDFESQQFTAGAAFYNAFRLEISRAEDNPVPMFFGQAVGINSPPMYEKAIVARQDREFMIAQDISGSFVEEMDGARFGLLNFASVMMESPSLNDKLGVSTFVGDAGETAWQSLSFVADAEEEILDQWYTIDTCNCNDEYLSESECEMAMVELASAGYGSSGSYEAGSCVETLCEEFYGGYDDQPWMPNCLESGSQSAPGTAIAQAVDELVNKGNPRSYQSVVLLTDGLACCGGETTERYAEAVAAADYAAANGIHVWTIGYNTEGDSASEDALLQLDVLTRGQGSSFVVDDSGELATALMMIADSVPLVVVQ